MQLFEHDAVSQAKAASFSAQGTSFGPYDPPWMRKAALRQVSAPARPMPDGSEEPQTSTICEDYLRPPSYTWTTTIDRNIVDPDGQVNDALTGGETVHSAVPYFSNDHKASSAQKLKEFVARVKADKQQIQLFRRIDPDGRRRPPLSMDELELRKRAQRSDDSRRQPQRFFRRHSTRSRLHSDPTSSKRSSRPRNLA